MVGADILVQSTQEVYERLRGEPLILMFSGGKDSIVMLDIAMRLKLLDIKIIHGYFCPNIPSREKFLTYYEGKYGVKIERRLSWYGASMKAGRTIKQAEIYNELRKEFNISYIAEGIKPTDSIVRNALIKQSDRGIDTKVLKCYPLYRWYDSAVVAYIKQNKLLLPVEYQAGVKHDLSNMTVESLQWVRHNLPADYEVIIKNYPKLKERMIHKELYCDQ